MWIIAKYKKKELNIFTQELKKKIEGKFEIYQPKILVRNIKKKYTTRSILGNYIFLWNKNFKDKNLLNCFKFSKGLEYLISNAQYDQNQIKNFINNCKNYENECGFLKPDFFKSIVKEKAKFVTAPFANKVFSILEKRENLLYILMDGVKLTLSNKSKYIYQPL